MAQITKLLEMTVYKLLDWAFTADILLCIVM